MAFVEVALAEWPEDGRGPRLLGMTADAAVVRMVREHLAGRRRAEAEALERNPAPALRVVPGSERGE